MKAVLVLTIALAASQALAGEPACPPPPLSRGEKLAAMLSPGLSQVLQAERERLVEYCRKKLK